MVSEAVQTPPKACLTLRESVNELRAALKARKRDAIAEALSRTEAHWPQANTAQQLLSRDRQKGDDASMKQLQMYADALNDANRAIADARSMLAAL